MTQPEIEKKILGFWRKNSIFQKSLDKPSPKGEYVFYDGPPFATGTPHYGHIVASLIKDMAPRYFTMAGFHVARRWGWDCHGLPIENIVEEELGFKHKKEIIAYGVDKFNEKARSKVLQYADEWRVVIERLGRWVDMEGAYLTMDKKYMESVWWVFKQLWGKGLIYEGFRSMHICPRCETTLSQSEVSEGYKEVDDLSAVAKFRIKKEALSGSFAGLDPLMRQDGLPPNGNDSISTNFVNSNSVDKQNRPGKLYHILSADAPIFLLAWTTTPWTLPGNAALAVGEDIEYVFARSGDGIVALAKAIFDRWSEEGKIAGEIVAAVKGKDLVGLEYEPLFPHYDNNQVENRANAFKVYTADFVNTEEGTGIVHIAPAFGEDDMNLGKRENLPFIQHVKMDGTFDFSFLSFRPRSHPQPRICGAKGDDEWRNPLDENGRKDKGSLHSPSLALGLGRDDILSQLQGRFVKEAEGDIVKYLQECNLLFSSEKFRHSYPHCWRCESPLLNYSASSYFVAVTKIKDELLRQAEGIRWVPEHIKEGRFGQWLANARDWSISRQRFWGSVIPIWKCQSDTNKKSSLLSSEERARVRSGKGGCGNIVVIGSAAELEKLSGKKVEDLHKHFVDKITFKCAECGGTMRRIPDVLDCWFESGAMPYATVPAPMLPKPTLSRPDGTSPRGRKAAAMSGAGWPFPARFIAEGVDQTRAWFYYLHVLAVALFSKAAFQNAVVNGIVLAEDGQKMSKRLSNYPDPMYMFDKYGADAVRYYLAASPVMRSEDLNFSEKGVEEVVKKVLLTLYNVLAFYKMYESKEKGISNKEKVEDVSHVLDRWIISKLNVLIRDITAAHEQYDLNRAVRPLGEFISELSTWYVRRSRGRFKGEDGEDKSAAIATLGHVLSELSKLAAPVMPFTAEHLWQEVQNNQTLSLREIFTTNTLAARDLYDKHQKNTLAARDLYDNNQNSKSISSVHLEEWPNPGNTDDEILTEMEQARQIVEAGLSKRAEAGIKVRQPLRSVTVKGTGVGEPSVELLRDELNVKEVIFVKGETLSVEFDTAIGDELRAEGHLRELVRQINALRKKQGLTVGDKVAILYQTNSSELKKVFIKFADELKRAVIASEIREEQNEGEEMNVNGEKARVCLLIKPAP